MKKAEKTLLSVFVLMMLVSCVLPTLTFHEVIYTHYDGRVEHISLEEGKTFTVPDTVADKGENVRIKIIGPYNKEYKPGDKIVVNTTISIDETKLVHVTYGDYEKWLDPGKEFTVPLLAKEGYVLKAIKDDKGNEVWNDLHLWESTVILKEDIAFEYIWAPANCTITFENAEHEPVKVANGSYYEIPSIHKDGFLIHSVSVNGKTYKPGDSVSVDEDIVLKYEWEKAMVVTVNGVPTLNLRAGSDCYLKNLIPAIPEGYRFKEMTINGEPVENVKAYYKVNKDLDVVCTWQKVWKVTVKGLDAEDRVVTVDDGSVYKIESAPEHHIIKKVSVTKDGKTEDLKESVTVDSDILVTYEIEKLMKVTIKHYIQVIRNQKYDFEKEEVLWMKKGTKLTPGWNSREGYGLEVQGKYKGDISVGDGSEIAYNWIPLHKITCINGDKTEILYTDVKGKVTIPVYTAPTGMDTAIITGNGLSYTQGSEVEINKETVLTWAWHEPYKVGDVGPAGGKIVFVDETDQYPDWKYMEIHPADKGLGRHYFGFLVYKNSYGWYYDTTVAGNKEDNRGFGKGRELGKRFAESMTPNTVTFEIKDRNSSIPLVKDLYNATYAVGVVKACREGGYSDWFLPTFDELYYIYNVPYKKLHIISIAKDNSPRYWTCSESRAYDGEIYNSGVDAVNFRDGMSYCPTRGKIFDTDDPAPYVRPIRVF